MSQYNNLPKQYRKFTITIKKMPPKPWLTKTGPPREDVSAIIQSNPTIKQQTPKLSMQPQLPQTIGTQLPSTTTNIGTTGTTGIPGVTSSTIGLGASTTGLGTSMTGLGGYGGYGSTYGGYGSSYGGYGGSYGGYGSSMYGGYGSSMYGMGGYGSYGMGYGRMGMMGDDPNKPSMVMNTLMTLQSLGFLIGSFCEIGRSLDHNIQGLHLFFNSFKTLFKKVYDAIMRLSSWMSEKMKNTILGIMNFVKTYVLLMNHKDDKNKMRALKIITEVCVVVLVISFYPQIKKVLGKVLHPSQA